MMVLRHLLDEIHESSRTVKRYEVGSRRSGTLEKDRSTYQLDSPFVGPMSKEARNRVANIVKPAVRIRSG